MLTDFNKTVLIVASILLILGLIIIGIFILKSLEEETYPPVVSDCPDYWDVEYSNGNKLCKNNTYINDGRSKNECRSYPTNLFLAYGASTNDKICEKYKWAKDCNIHWDGITNNPQACVNTTM